MSASVQSLQAGKMTEASRRGSGISSIFLSDYFMFYVSFAYVLALAPFFPTLLTPQNISNILANIWPLLVVAIGQTFVLAIAGVDLSQGAVIGFCSIFCAMLIATAGNPAVLGNAPIWGHVVNEQGGLLNGIAAGMPIAIGLTLCVAAAIGALNGVAVAFVGMPAFMTTLVMMLIFGAAAIYLPLSENINQLPQDFVALGKGDLISVYLGAKADAQIPRKIVYSFVTCPMVISLAVAFCGHVILNRTVFGRQVLAVGSNRTAAEISGVPVIRVIVMVFVISAICSGIASILYSGRLESGRPTLGAGTFLLDVIGAAVIGGTSLFGGKAKIKWTFFGVLFFVLLSNTLNLMNLTAFVVDMVKGGVIVIAALLDVFRTKLLQERAS